MLFKFVNSTRARQLKPILRWKTIAKPLSSIIGIETSCDDTGVAIINEDGKLLSERVATQTAKTVKLGGVIPLIAAELHQEALMSLVKSCFLEAQLGWKDISAIAVTVKPGMAPSLKVGVSFAKAAAVRYGLPIIPIHHMEAHALTVLFENQTVNYPFISVLLSGGHALVSVVRSLEDIVLLGKGLDAAPGDITDKLARRLKLSKLRIDQHNDIDFSRLSGGQSMELAAKLLNGNPRKYAFPLPRAQSCDCDFSFSGIHIAASRLIDKLQERVSTTDSSMQVDNSKIHKTILDEPEESAMKELDLQTIGDVCASIQYAITRLVCKSVQRAIVFSMEKNMIPKPSHSIAEDRWPALVVSGGVASNSFIRNALTKVAEHYGLRLICPSPRLCTDNGVMIAWNGLLLHREGRRIVNDIDKIDFEPKASFGVDCRALVRAAHIPNKKLPLL